MATSMRTQIVMELQGAIGKLANQDPRLRARGPFEVRHRPKGRKLEGYVVDRVGREVAEVRPLEYVPTIA